LITILDGVMVAIEGVPLLRFIVTDDVAAEGRLTAKGTDWLGPTVTPACKMMAGTALTLTLTVASGILTALA